MAWWESYRQIFGFPFPLRVGKPKRREGVVGRLDRRLNSWLGCYHLVLTRVMPVNAFLVSIPIYFMSLYEILCSAVN